MNCPKCGSVAYFHYGCICCQNPKCRQRYNAETMEKISFEKSMEITTEYSKAHQGEICTEIPSFQEEAKKEQQRQLAQIQQQHQPQPTPTQVTCPKCGSTQIQLVPRKWSLMTGIFTNKVDRVCVNCKTRF